MKKIFFILFGLSLFLTNVNATCYLIPQYPGSGSAPAAYCWDVIFVVSSDYPDGEATSTKSSTTYNHGGSEMLVYTDVYGYGDYTSVDINYDNMPLYQTINLINSYNIIVGKRYVYYRDNNTHSSGLIRVKNYSTVKDSLYFK